MGAALGKKSLAAQSNAPAVSESSLAAIWSTFRNRRSVRKYKPDPIPPEHLDTIIDMARTAPSSGNQQPWKFLIIQDRKRIDALKDAHIKSRVKEIMGEGSFKGQKLEEEKKKIAQYYEDYLSAPVNIFVLTDNDSDYPGYNHHDGPLAAGYLMLAARFLGYGTVYATDSINPDIARKLFNIPERYDIVCFTPLGIPVRWPEMPPKKELNEFIVRESF